MLFIFLSYFSHGGDLDDNVAVERNRDQIRQQAERNALLIRGVLSPHCGVRHKLQPVLGNSVILIHGEYLANFEKNKT